MENNGKLPAIVSYLTIIGWIIGMILHQNNPSSLSAIHLRQTIGLYIIWLLLSVVSIALSPFIISIASIFIAVLWLIGLLNAVGGKELALPVIGNFIEKTLKPYIN